METVTIEEIKEAINQQTAAREQALAQANFYAGSLSAWQELLRCMEQKEDGNTETSTPPVTRKRASGGNGVSGRKA